MNNRKQSNIWLFTVKKNDELLPFIEKSPQWHKPYQSKSNTCQRWSNGKQKHHNTIQLPAHSGHDR